MTFGSSGLASVHDTVPIVGPQKLKLIRLAVAVLVVVLGACTRGQPGARPDTTASPASSAWPNASPAPVPTIHIPVPSLTQTPPTPRPTNLPAFPASLRGQDVTRIPTTGRVVALTFDAGANADGLPPILATLERERIRATFFLTGDFVRHYPEAARSVRTHRIGNHTMTHSHLPALTEPQLRAQVLDAQATIGSVTGADPRPWFRFPYGDRSTRTIESINSLGYVAVRWSVDSLGWQGTGEHTAASVAARVLDSALPGQIVLMHIGSNPDDGSTLDADALPTIIGGLRSRGYMFVTVDALLAT
jgi:peptidoglycan/xylan/chitin deacetylase (PgdA/CDA1 family)